MDINRSRIGTIEYYYLGSHLLCLLAFLFPANSISVGGQAFTQYLLTGYPGWVVLSVIVVLFFVEAIYYLKTRNWPWWLGFVGGLYCFSYAVMLILKGYSRYKPTMADSLIITLNPGSTPLLGLWLLAAGGGILLIISVLKIIQKRSSPRVLSCT